MQNVKVYEVGGSVRDSFMRIKSKDVDHAVEASSYEAMKEYILSKGTIYLEKPEYLTIRAKIDNVDSDFVLCRRDGEYVDGRRPSEVIPGTIDDDLARRDFTVNAIAYLRNEDMYIDPYGGILDINNNILRCVGDTETRMREDSLRMLRAIRFQITKGFKLSPEIGNFLLSIDASPLLKNISKERIREELNKCFQHDTLKTLQRLDKYSRIRDYVFSDECMKLNVKYSPVS